MNTMSTIGGLGYAVGWGTNQPHVSIFDGAWTETDFTTVSTGGRLG